MAKKGKETLTKEEKKAKSKEAFENGEGFKAKLVSVLVFLAVLTVCFGGFFIVVINDVGGFASECLAPAFKYVPIINKFL